MIYVIMHGRLGNQMFQYAFAKKIQKNRKDGISIYFGKVTKRNGKGWANDLESFQVEDYSTENNLSFLIFKMSIRQKLLLAKYLYKCKQIEKIDDLIRFQCSMQPILNKNGLYWIRNGEFDPTYTEEKNVFICGHFEHYKFYEGMEDELKKYFTPKTKRVVSNSDFYSVLENDETVCISIRRGDFLDSKNRNEYYVCDETYFIRAISTIKELRPNITLVFFSDDIEWVKENFAYEGKVFYESPGNPVWEKIRLMSMCDHFIISNSSFSWWNQYLGESPEKIVISPSIWKRGSGYKGLINPKFITIETE